MSLSILDDSEDVKRDTCASCGHSNGKTKQWCVAYQSVQYCHKTCQARHWSTHKLECAKLKQKYLLRDAFYNGRHAYISLFLSEQQQMLCLCGQEEDFWHRSATCPVARKNSGRRGLQNYPCT